MDAPSVGSTETVGPTVVHAAPTPPTPTTSTPSGNKKVSTKIVEYSQTLCIFKALTSTDVRMLILKVNYRAVSLPRTTLKMSLKFEANLGSHPPFICCF